MSGLTGFWDVYGWFGWFVSSLDGLWVVWRVCEWFRVLQLSVQMFEKCDLSETDMNGSFFQDFSKVYKKI